eukprot:gene4502-7882_t
MINLRRKVFSQSLKMTKLMKFKRFYNEEKKKGFGEKLGSYFNVNADTEHALVKDMRKRINSNVDDITLDVLKLIRANFDQKIEFEKIYESKTKTKFTNFEFEFEVKVGDKEDLGVVKVDADYDGKAIQLHDVVLYHKDGEPIRFK